MHHRTLKLKNLNALSVTRLTKTNLPDRIFVCKTRQRRNDIDPFQKRFIMGGEKWITYHNKVQVEKIQKIEGYLLLVEGGIRKKS